MQVMNFIFNPAPTVKLPLALLALEKLNNMHINGECGINTGLYNMTAIITGQVTVYKDSTLARWATFYCPFYRKLFSKR